LGQEARRLLLVELLAWLLERNQLQRLLLLAEALAALFLVVQEARLLTETSTLAEVTERLAPGVRLSLVVVLLLQLLPQYLLQLRVVPVVAVVEAIRVVAQTETLVVQARQAL
jgi:hypothetical protein